MNINTARRIAKEQGCVLMTIDNDGMYYLKVATGHKAWKLDQRIQDMAGGEIRRMTTEQFQAEINSLLA